jgi:hypothetical protein
MKTSHFVVGAMAALVVGLSLYFFVGRSGAVLMAHSADAAVGSAAPPVAMKESSRGVLATVDTRSTAARDQAPPPESISQYRRELCDAADTECRMDPLSASTVEEARWLSQHGYPTHEQLAEYDGLTTDALRDKAETGNLVYRSLYGRRLLEEGEYVPGLGVLTDTARSGGLYALYVSSASYSNPGSIQPDVISSLADLRLAYLMGDSRAANALAKLASERGYGPVELRLADAQAAHLQQQMFPNMNASPRP